MYAPDMGPFFVRTTAVSVENTHNFAGGTVLPLEDLQALRACADAVGCGVHLDGARIWNAHVATGVPLASYGAFADVLAVCLSQGPRRAGRLAGGRHARTRSPRPGCVASGWAAGCARSASSPRPALYALDHHVERLADDHAHARLLAEACGVDPADGRDQHRGGRRAGRAGVRRRRPGGRRAGRPGRAARRPPGHPPRRQPADAQQAATVLARL